MSVPHSSSCSSRTRTVEDECHDYVKTMSKDLLKCGKCHESFNSRVRPPLMLQCFHAFCRQCLKAITEEGSVACPLCQRKFPEVADVPVDVTRLALRLYTHGVWCREGLACEGCSESAKATFYCQECAEFLCEDCSKAHGRVKYTTSHTVVKLADAVKSPAKHILRSDRCERHTSEEVSLYCECCRKTACALCALSLHKECYSLLPLEPMMESKKKEILGLCDQLDIIKETFQAKLNVCLKSLESVETNLSQSIKQVECVIGDLISVALERQGELSEELRTKARADGVELDKQALTLRSLLAAAQAAADYGRRIVILNLVEQVIDQNAEIEENVMVLKKETECHLNPVLEYQMVKDKLNKIKDLIRSFGGIECTRSVTVTATASCFYPLECPDFKLDVFHCGPHCSLQDGGLSLSNVPRPRGHPRHRSHGFTFHGTCGTAALTGKTSYWQVTCTIIPSPEVKREITLCEVGVATQEALHSSDVSVTPSEHCALTVKLYQTEEKLMALICYKTQTLSDLALASAAPNQRTQETLGFALDSTSRRLWILSVRDPRVLCENHVGLSEPLWPAFCVVPAAFCSARVCLSVQSGQRVNVSPAMVSVLEAIANQ